MRDVHQGSDVVHMDVVRVQVRVDAVGNLLWRPTPPEIVADKESHPDECLLVALRPSKAGATQLVEVRVASGIGCCSRSASNQGSANYRGDGQCRQPAR